MRIMKKNFKVLLIAVFVAIASCSFTTKKFDNPEKDKLLIDLITYVLEKGHYSPKDMDDAFSRNIYKNFFNHRLILMVMAKNRLIISPTKLEDSREY